MSTTLQANQSFGAKLLHILTLGTRDVYKTDNGQLITMKADQGRVEVDDDGEVNIFDAENVKAKGVDGVEDEFYLHNCTGENNKGKNLNDEGDIFTQVKDSDATSGTSATSGADESSSSSSTSDSSSSDLGSIFNTTVNGNEGEINITNNYYPAEVEETEETEEAEETEETEETEEAEDTEETEETEDTDTTSATSSDSSTTEELLKQIIAIFNTIINGNNGEINISNNYYGNEV